MANLRENKGDYLITKVVGLNYFQVSISLAAEDRVVLVMKEAIDDVCRCNILYFCQYTRLLGPRGADLKDLKPLALTASKQHFARDNLNAEGRRVIGVHCANQGEVALVQDLDIPLIAVNEDQFLMSQHTEGVFT